MCSAGHSSVTLCSVITVLLCCQIYSYVFLDLMHAYFFSFLLLFFFQAEDGIRYLVRSRGLGDVYKRQAPEAVAAADRLYAELWEAGIEVLYDDREDPSPGVKFLSLIHI